MLLAIYIEDGQLLPLKLDIGMMSPKRWPKGGQKWDIKEKRFCFFAHFELLAKSSVPGTGLEPALLAKYAPETYASTNSATRARVSFLFFLVPRTRLELARLNRHYPLKVACLPISPPGLIVGCLFPKSECKSTSFFNTAKKNFIICCSFSL